MYQRQEVCPCRPANIHQMKQLEDKCIEMEVKDMWEWDVTRDGRATARKGNVGIEANRAVVGSTRCPRSILHPSSWMASGL